MKKEEKDLFPPINSFHPIPSFLFYDLIAENGEKPKLNLEDLGTYALLRVFAHEKGVCHVGINRLSTMASCSPSTINRSLRRLIAANHIQRFQTNRSSTATTTLLSRVENGKIIRVPKTVYEHAPRRLGAPFTTVGTGGDVETIIPVIPSNPQTEFSSKVERPLDVETPEEISSFNEAEEVLKDEDLF